MKLLKAAEIMAQEMSKHEALLHLLWAVSQADSTSDDEKFGATSSIEDEYYEKVKKAEGIDISFDVINEKLDGVPILSEHHQVDCEKVLVELRNCLLKLGIPDDSNFDIQMLKGKVTERTKNNLVKEDLLKML